MYLYSSRDEYSDTIVTDLMEYLVNKGILKKPVDLEEFPDLLPLLMPFDLVFLIHKWWNEVEVKRAGFDLRKVKQSDLVELFNMNVVEKYLKDGGVYIVSEIVHYNRQ